MTVSYVHTSSYSLRTGWYITIYTTIQSNDYYDTDDILYHCSSKVSAVERSFTSTTSFLLGMSAMVGAALVMSIRKHRMAKIDLVAEERATEGNFEMMQDSVVQC